MLSLLLRKTKMRKHFKRNYLENGENHCQHTFPQFFMLSDPKGEEKKEAVQY
jgi:hypothetical protein